MSPKEVRRRLDEKPFQPFVMITADGERHEVRHPENARLLPGGVVYLFHPIDSGEAQVDYPIAVSLPHVTTIEPLPNQAA
jgi:hypothetical protein